MGEIGDQNMEPISDADWSGESLMDEGDPAAPTDMDVGERTMRYEDFPNVHFQAAAAKSYETSGDIGKPEWDSLFGYILAKMSHLRFMSTACSGG